MKTLKLRHPAWMLGLILLSACNFTLAEDVTPPADYVAPTPMPTLGPLFPAAAPDITNGAVIYAEKCAACHGVSGLGDGEQGKQLPVPVAALALAETAHKASPAAWFTMVSQGNLDRFMPPFTSLSEQERWDVVFYALTLHTTPQQIAAGKILLDSSCSHCAAKFSDQKLMASLTENDLVRIMRDGQGDIPAFGANFSEDEAYAAAAYLRTLTIATPAPPTEIATIDTPAAAAQNPASAGMVRGTIENHAGGALPAAVKVVLRGYEHDTQSGSTPQEIVTLETSLSADGSYQFNDVQLPDNRIFRTELIVGDITYQSEFLVAGAGTTSLTFAPIKVYASTEDYSALKLDALQIYFDFANAQNVQMLAVYSFINSSNKTVVVKLSASQQIPFIKMPSAAGNIGYEASPDSAGFIQLENGFAMPPSDTPYGLVAFSALPKQKELVIEQPVALDVSQIMLLVPQGVEASGDGLQNAGPHEFQGGKFNLYTSGAVQANDSLTFTLSGEPSNTAVNPNVLQSRGLVIVVGALGVALIVAGVWVFRRERQRAREVDDDSETEDADGVLDSILALDDLHRAGKLSDDAYIRRRNELKRSLKRESK